MSAIAIAGAVAGVAYTVSPLTALFAAMLPCLFWWAGRGLDARERRWVWGLLTVAVLLRTAAIAVLLVTTDPARQPFNTYFPDATFAIARSWWIRNMWLDVPIGPAYLQKIFDPYGASSYSYILGAIQLLAGPSPYALNFISVAAFLAGAIALYRVARHSLGSNGALAGFAWLLFWPTMFAWSVSMLKESMQFALTACLIVLALHAVRAPRWRVRVAAALVALAVGYVTATLRSAAVAIGAAGVMTGVAAWAVTRRRRVAIASAILVVAGVAVTLSRPAVQQRLMDETRMAANRQVGHVASVGHGYKLLDQRFYSEGAGAAETMDPTEAVRFLARATIAFFTMPWPWEIPSRGGLVYLPQQLAWYALLLLAIPGAVAGFRRDPLVTWILLASVAASVAVIAPNSGNIGTLVRHRDMAVPILVWLSGAGAASIISAAAAP